MLVELPKLYNNNYIVNTIKILYTYYKTFFILNYWKLHMYKKFYKLNYTLRISKINNTMCKFFFYKFNIYNFSFMITKSFNFLKYNLILIKYSKINYKLLYNINLFINHYFFNILIKYVRYLNYIKLLKY
jgi:hypothetical protein